MSLKNISILTSITIFSIVLFALFFNLLSKEMAPLKNGSQVESSVAITNTDQSSETKPTPTTDPTTSSASSKPTPVVKLNSVYKDGTYTATISYQVPKAKENIAVTMTLQNDVITSVSNTHSGNKSDSRAYQSSFQDSLAINNKKIDASNVSIVGGASLTSAAFNQALNNIKNQAKA